MSKSRGNAKQNMSKAVALRYRDGEDKAPVVIASGYGTIAENIIEIAEQKGVPVFRDDSAASLMCMLDVGKSIPPELYEAVAAIYAQILRISAEIKDTEMPAGPVPEKARTAAQIESRMLTTRKNQQKK